MGVKACTTGQILSLIRGPDQRQDHSLYYPVVSEMPSQTRSKECFTHLIGDSLGNHNKFLIPGKTGMIGCPNLRPDMNNNYSKNSLLAGEGEQRAVRGKRSPKALRNTMVVLRRGKAPAWLQLEVEDGVRAGSERERRGWPGRKLVEFVMGRCRFLSLAQC